MKNIRKLYALLLSSSLLALLIPGTAFAREKIEEISLNFSADLDADEEWPAVRVSGDEEGYLIDDFKFQVNQSEKYPQGVVTLIADDDYYFGTIKASNCTLEGEGAVYVKAIKKTSSQLNLTVSFREMGDGQIQSPGSLGWLRDGSVFWDRIPAAKAYQVRLMKDGKSLIPESLETTGCSFDFSSHITAPGNYYFRVRAISRYNASTTSEWVNSPTYQVDEASLSHIQADSPQPPDTPGRWIFDNNVWYWENPDGSRASSQWVFYNGGRYYLNADAGMATGWNWIKGSDGLSRCYYFNSASGGELGRLYTNSTAPDGSAVNEDGAWILNGVVQTR